MKGWRADGWISRGDACSLGVVDQAKANKAFAPFAF
jgi:hypothetical protein